MVSHPYQYSEKVEGNIGQRYWVSLYYNILYFSTELAERLGQSIHLHLKTGSWFVTQVHLELIVTQTILKALNFTFLSAWDISGLIILINNLSPKNVHIWPKENLCQVRSSRKRFMLLASLVNVFLFVSFPCPLMTIGVLFVICLTFSLALCENNCPLPTKSSTEAKLLLKKKQETSWSHLYCRNPFRNSVEGVQNGARLKAAKYDDWEECNASVFHYSHSKHLPSGIIFF